MELAIYKALKSINIEEHLVDSVINAMEAHFEDRVGRATEPLLAKMDSMKGSMDALKDSLSAEIRAFATVKTEADKVKELRGQRTRWVVGTFLGTSVSVVGLMVVLAKAFGII
ncbi:MAG: hypothetical protein ABIZ18_15765 [Caldimonas sp.]